jgi:hypothetical protein
MNDKIKQLLKNAEESDAIAKLKWRIENREALREQRKKELKELMERDATEAAMEEYNRMEEEWEMDNYNEMKDEQKDIPADFNDLITHHFWDLT